MDMSVPLQAIYDNVDPVTMETLVTEQLPLFERQWNTMVHNVDIANKEGAVNKLSQAAVSEPLKSYYNHGRVSSPRSGQGSAMKVPFVLFGRESVKTDGQVGSTIFLMKINLEMFRCLHHFMVTSKCYIFLDANPNRIRYLVIEL